MKQVNIAINGVSRTANANEYPIRLEPKGEPFKVTLNGVEVRARKTSGRGKSAIPNHYLYFIEGERMFYVKVSPAEFGNLNGATLTDFGGETNQNDAPETVQAAESAVEEPKSNGGKRRRVAKA
jgi:hypothetical protein